MDGIEVPAPEFTVTVSAETSYSRYLAGSNNKNDSGTGDKIMNIQAIVGISSNILGKSHYAGLLTGTLKGDGTTLNNTSTTAGIMKAADLTEQEWKQHTISATFIFDGTEKSEAVNCYVTGLPYSVDFLNNTSPAGWAFDNCGTNSPAASGGEWRFMKPTTAFAQSPTFYIPQSDKITSVNIQSTFIGYAYNGWGGSYSPVIKVNASNDKVNSGTGTSISTGDAYPATADFTEVKSELSLTATIRRVCYCHVGESSGGVTGIDKGV